jgi:hypothetical protein
MGFSPPLHAPYTPRGLSLLQDSTAPVADHRSVAALIPSPASPLSALYGENLTAPPCPMPLLTPPHDLGENHATSRPPQHCRTREPGSVTVLCARSVNAVGRFPGWARPTVPGLGPKPAQHCASHFFGFSFSFKIPEIHINSKIRRKCNKLQKI